MSRRVRVGLGQFHNEQQPWLSLASRIDDSLADMEIDALEAGTRTRLDSRKACNLSVAHPEKLEEICYALEKK